MASPLLFYVQFHHENKKKKKLATSILTFIKTCSGLSTGFGASNTNKQNILKLNRDLKEYFFICDFPRVLLELLKEVCNGI